MLFINIVETGYAIHVIININTVFNVVPQHIASRP